MGLDSETRRSYCIVDVNSGKRKINSKKLIIDIFAVGDLFPSHEKRH